MSTHFSFDVKYNNKQTNPQGEMTIDFQSWYKPDGTLDGEMHHYKVKTNAINLFAIGTENIPFLGDNQAIFDAKANLSEIMDDGTVMSIDGNSPLHVTITDGDWAAEPVADEIGITYYRKDGGIWFSSYWNWNAMGTLDNPLTLDQAVDGDIMISADCDDSDYEYKSAKILTPLVENARLDVYPNPFSRQVRFEFAVPEDGNARIEIFDMTGRKVKTVFEGAIAKDVVYDAEFRPETQISGMYLYRMTLNGTVFNGKMNYKARE